MPLIGRAEKRLSSISPPPSYGGRLIMVNFVLTPPNLLYVHDQTPNYNDQQCLWRGSDINRKGGCLAVCKNVCKQKNQGVLGIINLRIQNDALRSPQASS